MVNNIETDQLGINLKEGMEDSELFELRIKQCDNPYLFKLTKLEEGKTEKLTKGITKFKLVEGSPVGK